MSERTSGLRTEINYDDFNAPFVAEYTPVKRSIGFKIKEEEPAVKTEDPTLKLDFVPVEADGVTRWKWVNNTGAVYLEAAALSLNSSPDAHYECARENGWHGEEKTIGWMIRFPEIVHRCTFCGEPIEQREGNALSALVGMTPQRPYVWGVNPTIDNILRAYGMKEKSV